MPGLSSIWFVAIWLALVSITTSSPITGASVPILKNTAAVPVAHNANYKPRHGALQLYRTLNKHGLAVPEDLQAVRDRLLNTSDNDNQDAEIDADSEDGDLEWLAAVSIGTPPQRLNLDFDTGSADTWVFSTETSKFETDGEALYNASKSSTAQKTPNATWEILYGDGSSCSGIIYQDTLRLGNLSIANMTIESAQTVTPTFETVKSLSGLLGMGWPSLIQTYPIQPSLLDFLPHALQKPLFTSDLKHNSTGGSYNFGFIDDSLHYSDVEYINVDNSQGYWGVLFKGFAIGSEPFKYEYANPQSVIIDTGSTLFYAPEEAVSQYWKAVPSAKYSEIEYGYVVPCNASLPDFFWELSDTDGNTINGTVPGAYFIYDVIGDGMCFAGLQSLDGISTMQGILGDIWIKSAFQVWNVGTEQFGSAPKLLNTDLDTVEHVVTSKVKRKTVFV